MSLKVSTLFTVEMLFVLLIAGASLGHADAKCSTSSGSECKVTCSEGTASAVCSDNSKVCSTSCSDSSGNMERNLIRSLEIVTQGRLDSRDARYLLDGRLNVQRLWSRGGRHRVNAGGGTITIDVDR